MKRFLLKYSAIGFLIIGMAGCDDYLDINTNPNEPTTAPIKSLMSTASFRTGENIQLMGNITSYYVQYLAGPVPSSSTDIHLPVPYDDTWFNIYHILGDIADLELLATDQGATQYVGAAKILKAIHLGLLLDAWGDVPYSKALFAQSVTPEYDSDEQLYAVIIQLLDDGIAELKKSGSTVTLGADDFIYGGGATAVERWIKLGYALKARNMLHLSNTGQYAPNDILTLMEDAFDSNADNADITYFTTVFNPWARVARRQAGLLLDGWISQQLADAMNGTTFGVVDPRMPFMFGDNEEGDFIGVPNGAGRGDGVDVQGERSVLELGTYYASDLSPVLVFTFAEQKFIEAEVAFDAGQTPRAYQAYLAGIRAHMDMIGVDPADRDAYLAEPSVDVGEANFTKALIMKEKYVAMFLHPEAWNDARRYNFAYQDMTVPANLNPDLNGNYARRLVYPDSETTRNGVNVPDASQLTRIFWDEN